MDLKFTVFADFHYSKGMYCPGVYDLRTIMARANAHGSAFVLHAGDFCNNYKDSPEVLKAYLQNEYNLPVFGCYGNHELERGNEMAFVTPHLTNQTDVQCNLDGTMPAPGTQGYYFCDRGDYRLIFTDTNYSRRPDGGWEHNYAGSHGAPSDNDRVNALGPEQLIWLKDVLHDAAKQGKHCIVVGHATCIADWSVEEDLIGDYREMLELLLEANVLRKNTVILVINGHYHTNRTLVRDNILFWDVNSAINGYWMPDTPPHYTKDHVYLCEKFDEAGEKIGESYEPLSDLRQANNSFFFETPVSADVTITDAKEFTIRGVKTKWRYGLVPDVLIPGCMPEISDWHYCLDC